MNIQHKATMWEAYVRGTIHPEAVVLYSEYASEVESLQQQIDDLEDENADLRREVLELKGLI